MDPIVALSVGLVLLCAVLITGLPIYIGFLLLNLAGVAVFFGVAGTGMFANSMLESMSSLNMTAVPLFVMMGEVLFRSGAVDVVFESVDRLIGRIHGRLYVFTIVLSTIFGALCGSAVAVVSMLGRSVLPAMVKRGYDIELSASMIQGGASLAPIIPPSLLAVIIGSMAGVSISGLLIAGILPGLLLALLSIGYAFWALWRNPRFAPAADAPGSTKRISITRALLQMLPFSIIVFSVLGVILLGVATPSEAAATGVLGSFVTAAIYRRLSWRMAIDAIKGTVRISTMILIIVATSVLFGQLLAFTGATARTVQWFATLDLPPLVMFLLMMAVPFVLCMFIDQLAFMLVAIPIYAPLVSSLNFDPIWFWTMFSINMTLASLTPPFGYTMFALRAAAPDIITLKQVFDSSWPITWVFVLGMVVMTAVPEMVTFLPAVLK